LKRERKGERGENEKKPSAIFAAILVKSMRSIWERLFLTLLFLPAKRKGEKRGNARENIGVASLHSKSRVKAVFFE